MFNVNKYYSQTVKCGIVKIIHISSEDDIFRVSIVFTTMKCWNPKETGDNILIRELSLRKGPFNSPP